MTIRVWAHAPRHGTLCGCGDPGLFLSFIAWPVHALGSGQNPLNLGALMVPHGLNMLSATSVLALSIPMIPITWLFGPLLSLNVLTLLAPVLSALAAYFFAKRFTDFWPAATVGGFLYGFSSYVISQGSVAHLMLSAAWIPPLLAICVDDLLRTHDRSWKRLGAYFALLIVTQFFISTEMLLLDAMFFVPLVFCILVFLALKRREVGDAVKALTLALGISLVTLSYPLWYALFGPEHLSGAAWGGTGGGGGVSWGGFFDASRISDYPVFWRHFSGQTSLPFPSASFLGPSLVLLAIGGILVRRRFAERWILGAAALWGMLLSLSGKEPLSVWRHLSGIGFLASAFQDRVIICTILCFAVLVAVLIGDVFTAVSRVGQVQASSQGSRWRLLPALVAAVLAVIAIAPAGLALAPALPYGVQSVTVPRWFAVHGKSVTAGTVILPSPAALTSLSDPQVWQVLDGFQWSQPGILGPQALPSRMGAAGPGTAVIDAIGVYVGQSLPPASLQNIRAVRAALHVWNVDKIVIPSWIGGLTQSIMVRPSYVAGFYTATLGRLPKVQDGAWVWTLTRVPMTPPHPVSANVLNSCADRLALGGKLLGVSQCVIKSPTMDSR